MDEQYSSIEHGVVFSGRMKGYCLGAVLFSVLLSVLAAFRGGYIGPDYQTHLARLIEWPKIFDFSTTNPPLYYLLGHGLFRLLGSNNGFPITLCLIQISLNAAALWWFFGYAAPRFQSRMLYLAFAFFLTFLPVRIIHAASIGTDWATIPLFVLLLFLFDGLRAESTATPGRAVLFGLGLTLALATKYSFMALLPAALGIFICLAIKRSWKARRLIVMSLLSFTLPALLAFYSFYASSRVHGYNTEKHWLPKGMAADMNYKDLFSIKRNDALLFRAPEYFKREILAAHEHGYLALSHLGVFTDPMNLFQVMSIPTRFGSILIPDQKVRKAWKTPVMRASMTLGVTWTALALIATMWAFARAVRDLLARARQLEREDVTILFGVAFFLLMFLPIPFVYSGALFGYWTPRLILPSLVAFFFAAFLLIDHKTRGRPAALAGFIFALVVVQCAIEALVLI